MGVATGCGFKEIYRFPHTTYPYSSCICTYLLQHPYIFVHLKKFFSFFYIYNIIYIASYMPFSPACETGLSEYVDDSSVNAWVHI